MLVGILQADNHFIIMGLYPGDPGFREGICNGHARVGRPDGHESPPEAILEVSLGVPVAMIFP